MWVRVSGAAAGGGFPQWNCNCPNCRGARDRSLPCRSRTQSSLAVSSDRQHWFLFNASPDIRSQIETFPPLWPRNQLRHTPIQAVVLTDAELDHTIGLLCLRETQVLRVYATEWVHRALSEWNPILRTLHAYCEIDWQCLDLRESVELRGLDGLDSGLRCRAFATGGLVRRRRQTDSSAGLVQARGPVDALLAAIGLLIPHQRIQGTQQSASHGDVGLGPADACDQQRVTAA
jgi:pyrroloquinoline quinone biosynthesis protein B